MNKKISIFTSLLIFFTIEISAQEYLEPNNSALHDFSVDYYTKIQKILFKDTNITPIVQYLALPSFSPEYALNMEYELVTNKYYFQYNICDISVWSTMYKNKNRNKKPKLIVKKKYTDENTLNLILALFKKAINQTKYPDKNAVTTDGTNYHFLVDDNGFTKDGSINSPYTGKMKKLVEIGESLIEFVKSDETELNPELVNRINVLTKEL